MSSKKSAKKRPKKTNPNASARNGAGRMVRSLTTEGGFLGHQESDETAPQTPVRINPESREERDKRIAARKARTLRAFKATYENRQQRKAS